jgi:molybdopterin/thiamine biosynthesis adenylyltransferase
MVDRNIGFIRPEQQEQLRTTKVAVFGMGGIGGTAFEVLVRTGIGRFSIIDRDVFEASNMNRQVFAYRQTLGRRKIDVAAEWARAINPDVQIELFDRVGEDNIGAILAGAGAAVGGIDSLEPCIIAARACRQLNIPLIEGWAIPYANVRVFTQDTVTLEEAYGLPTAGRAVSSFTQDDFRKFNLELLLGMGKIDGIRNFYPPEVVEQIINKGRLVSFAPAVWLTSVMMAMETIKVLLAWGEIALAPRIALYDPFQHRVVASPEA